MLGRLLSFYWLYLPRTAFCLCSRCRAASRFAFCWFNLTRCISIELLLHPAVYPLPEPKFNMGFHASNYDSETLHAVVVVVHMLFVPMQRSRCQRLLRSEPFGLWASTKKQSRALTPAMWLESDSVPTFHIYLDYYTLVLRLSIGLCKLLC